MSKKRSRIVIPREVLLVEIERHCADTSCNARTRIGLTKAEARLYDGFECERCERWNEDGLNERDIPEWWEELTITGLDTLRVHKLADTADTDASGEGVVARLSEAWQRKARREGQSAKDEPDGSDRGDESV
ncbi:MAG TPA: hypothetical protein VGO96_06605 [Pyrinomonadaceae bacterium]|jgi:hypothetical protein|nr:hypothetical protein [Pyrinomonadaceae bacterium]